jgi:N-acetylmuramic acid 6-phosphate etherase
MVNMQLTNLKLINRGTRMIMAELGYDEVTAKRLLLLHGSVNAVLEAEKEGKGN